MNSRFRPLPEPHFVDRDGAAILAELITHYEADTGKTLYPAQVERLLVNQIAYRETVQRIALQEAAKQNLIRFAEAPIIDYLCEALGVYRLPAQAARTRLRFSLAAALPQDVLIPTGTRAELADGRLRFATTVEATLLAGQLSVEADAEALEAGPAGNGWLAGQIATLVDVQPGIGLAVSNITTTSGGADEESTENLRERYMLATEAFTNAGSAGAYAYHARSAHQDIVDVAVRGPELEIINGQLVSLNGIPPGVVRLYPLTKGGLPDSNILSLVMATCSPAKVRPLTDKLEVLAPEPVAYTLVFNLRVHRGVDANAVREAVRATALAFAAERAGRLGQDVVREHAGKEAWAAGTYKLEVVQPAADLVLQEHQWPQCLGVTVNLVGIADE